MNFLEGNCEFKNGSAFFNEGNFSIKLDDRLNELLKEYDGKDLVFGIRPEDIYSPENAPEVPEEDHVTANVEVVEPMGSETYVYMNTGKSSFIARVDASIHATESQQQKLAFDVTKAHVFDPQTEITIL